MTLKKLAKLGKKCTHMYETEIQCNPNNLLTENQCVHVQAAKGQINSLHAQFFLKDFFVC